jgi:hypothetical protein
VGAEPWRLDGTEVEMRYLLCGVATFGMLAGLALTGSALADEMKFTANLTGPEEVPPTDSAGTGTADVTFNSDNKQFTWTIEFSGLSGPATAAHFHGPAGPGENAGPVVPIADLESPSEGSATLTDEQAEQLANGQWYVNIHTAAHPDGEIRGQVKKGM